MVQNELAGGSLSDRIVAAAVSHLEDCWSESIDLNDVARRMGVEPELVSSIFPDSAALNEAVCMVGVARLSDRMNRELVAAPTDPRGALTALAWGYVSWARDNPRLYRIVSGPLDDNALARRYDASFVPLIRRFLGETEGSSSRRLAIARSLISGVTQLVLAGHFDLWMPEGSDLDTELRASIAEGVDLLIPLSTQG